MFIYLYDESFRSVCVQKENPVSYVRDALKEN